MEKTDVLVRAANEFEMGVQVYRTVAARVRSFRAAAADERLGDEARQMLSIVFDSCCPYFEQAADALEAATARMRAAAEVPPKPDAPTPNYNVPQLPGPFSAAQLGTIAQEFERTAGLAYNLVQRHTKLAEEVADFELTGDTHPYGDVVYGIAVMYLIRCAESLSQESKRLLAEGAGPR